MWYHHELEHRPRMKLPSIIRGSRSIRKWGSNRTANVEVLDEVAVSDVDFLDFPPAETLPTTALQNQ